MYYSIKGKITYCYKDFIVLETNNIGYKIFVSHPSLFTINEEYKLMLHHVIKEDDEYLVGFSSFEEKKVFYSLLNVKGIGPKTAISILGKTTPEKLMNAITSNNLLYLKNLPNIGAKGAAQILLDLGGRVDSNNSSLMQFENVKKALKKLGYKVNEIENVLMEINIPNATEQVILKEALIRLGSKI